MKTLFRGIWIGWIALVLCALNLNAQWQQQVIHLKPGWNAVFLEVDPVPSISEKAFEGMPVRSAWMWDRPGQVVDYVDNLASLVPGKSEWRIYLPPGDPNIAVKNLFDLEGGRALLVNLGGAQSIDWVLTGKPRRPRYNWVPDSYNLVGFPLESNSIHTFTSLFSTSAAHANRPVLKLSSSGQWTRVLDLGKERVEPGRAYWVFTSGASSFDGPIEIATGQGKGLGFGESAVLGSILLGNPGSTERVYFLDPRPSAPAPAGEALVGGDVPLAYRRFSVDPDSHAGVVDWLPLTNRTEIRVPAGEALNLQIEAQRSKAKRPTVAGARDFQSLLSISESNGYRTVVPVNMRVAASFAAGSAALAGPQPNPMAGLWVGNVLIDQVNFSGHPSDPDLLRPARSEFDFRVLVHLDEAGNARFLQRVMVMWRPGSNSAEAGRFVVVTDESLASRLGATGVAVRNERPVVRRFSAPAFAFREPLAMESVGKFGEGALRCIVSTDYNDSLNPFKHVFHPDHDNLDPTTGTVLPDGVESFSISRQIELRFTNQEQLRTTNAPIAYMPGFGDTRVGGTYREVITGVHRRAIRLGGTFTLQRAVSVGRLNDE